MDAFGSCDAQLARAGAHRCAGGEQRGARDLAAARDDQHASLRLLVAVDHRRKRMQIKRRPVELHRVPAIASGADVFGAPSASSGAP